MEDYIVYNFEAMDQAIKAYQSQSKRISELAGNLQSLVARVNEAMQSDAGTTCANKLQELSQTVTNAQEQLNVHISKLSNNLEEASGAATAAAAIANNIQISFPMQ